ncbi:MAG: HAD-IIB family hydrolase [Sandaracinaceae bacterium]|nr:HAD-IIB family hydrolase [Sandaracinaceae bacterium]
MLATDHSFLVFTDLDGTLLDHDTYSFEPARPMVTRLAQMGAVLVLTSSKTEPEMRALRTALGNDAPFVVENGSVVCMPAREPGAPDEHVVHGAPYADIRRVLTELRATHGFDFVGFGDLDAAGVAELTGLSTDDAARAKQRAGTEPLVWRDTDEALVRFERAVQDAGLHVTRGGRFVHVMGHTDKGRAVPFLRAHYETLFPSRTWTTVGLGDSENDLPLLHAVDVAIVVRKPSGAWLPFESARPQYRTALPGPAGWAATLAIALDDATRAHQQPSATEAQHG